LGHFPLLAGAATEVLATHRTTAATEQHRLSSGAHVRELAQALEELETAGKLAFVEADVPKKWYI